MADLLLRGERVLVDGRLRPATVLVSGGTIQRIAPFEESGEAGSRADAGDAVVMPGVVDVHVHVNEPGRTEWEGFESAGRAAAAGGITCLVDMPLNSSPVTTDVTALEAKAAAARESCAVDYGFWGGVIPGNLNELLPLLDAGVLGFKAFLVASGIEEFPPVGEKELRPAMRALAGRGALLLAHAELPGLIAASRGEPRRYATYLATRPPEAEIQAVELLVRLSRETGCRVHVVHVSASASLEIISLAKAEGLGVSCETCPHYLTFAAAQVPDGATEFKCAPPIRDAENRERLWAGLKERVIDLVSSDHSPSPPELKCQETGDFLAAWGGISSLQLLLPAVWTGARERGRGIPEVARWLCERPARLAGLGDHKGRIAPGYDADFVVWDPEAAFPVSAEGLYHRHSLTPYLGRTLMGRVLHTYVRGVSVCEHGQPTGRRPGRWMRSPPPPAPPQPGSTQL